MTLNVHEMAKAVAAALGPNWSFALEANCGPFFALLRGPSIELNFSSTNLDKGRFVIGANWPRSRRSHADVFPRGYQVTVPDSITVAGTKTPEQIAKDILRRVVPEVADLYLQGLQQRDEFDKWHDDTDKLAKEFAALVGREPHALSPRRIFLYPDEKERASGEVQVNGPDSVRLTLDVNGAAAREILKGLGWDLDRKNA